MSLDQNLFTLAITASSEGGGSLDLTDPNTNTIHYRKRPNPGDAENPYSWGFFDPLSDGLLCSVTAPSASSKQKWIELHNPDVKVELTYAASFTFKWNFDWEGHTFEWRRENCFLLRKPDPPVQVAVTREPAGRIKTSQVQILDYNLNRFDIEDRKGLEIVMLAALLTFQDHSDALRATPAASPPPSRHNSEGTAPPIPPKSGAEIISSLQAVNRAQSNDVIVGAEGQVEDYANHCVDMLKDPSMLYIVLRPQSPEHVGKVIQVAETTKRFHYKSGAHDEELHQYVTMEDAKPEKKGPKVIKLDDDKRKKDKEKEYKPPQTVTVHLSKIPMPELQPKAPSSSKPSTSPSQNLLGKKGGRTPSPSRPPASASSSSSSAHKLSKQSSPPPNPQPNPYRYDMALYPPTGPMPSFYDPKQKPPKQEGKKDSNKPRPNPSPSGSNYPMPGAYPGTPNASGSGSGAGAMNANRPPPPPTSGYPGFSRPPPPPGPPYSGGPPPGPPPSAGQQQQQQQPASLSTQLTNNLATVGYSLLDKLTHKNAPPSGPSKQ